MASQISPSIGFGNALSIKTSGPLWLRQPCLCWMPCHQCSSCGAGRCCPIPGMIGIGSWSRCLLRCLHRPLDFAQVSGMMSSLMGLACVSPTLCAVLQRGQRCLPLDLMPLGASKGRGFSEFPTFLGYVKLPTVLSFMLLFLRSTVRRARVPLSVFGLIALRLSTGSRSCSMAMPDFRPTDRIQTSGCGLVRPLLSRASTKLSYIKFLHIGPFAVPRRNMQLG